MSYSEPQPVFQITVALDEHCGVWTHLLLLHLLHDSSQILSLKLLVQQLQLQLTLGQQLHHKLIRVWRHLSHCVLTLARSGTDMSLTVTRKFERKEIKTKDGCVGRRKENGHMLGLRS